MRLLLYSDVNGFGGHEVMTLHALRYLATHTDWSIKFIGYEGNTRFLDHVRQIPNIVIETTPHRSRSLQGFRSWLQFGAVRQTMSLLTQEHPDLILFSQGGIEQGSVGLIAGHKLKLNTVSYIPYAHTYKKMHSKLAPLRDLIAPSYYKLPLAYITIGKSMEHDLRKRGANQVIKIVPNGIDTSPLLAAHSKLVNAEMNKNSGPYTVGIAGRISCVQKGHDVLIRAIDRVRREDKNIRLLIIGDGPDRAAMEKLCADLSISESVEFQPWTSNMLGFYKGIDLLAISSHFEGVPLVMLEAMAFGLPIVASDVDGMRDTLPSDWLFPSGDSEALAQSILRMRSSDQRSQIEANRVRAQSEFDLDKFGQHFREALEELASQPGA